MELGGFGNQSKNIKIGFLYNQRNDMTVQQIKRLVHKYDFLHAGFMIDDGWYKATNEKYIISKGSYNCGGHAVIIAGFLPEGVIIQNSWGKQYGAKGFIVLPWSLVKEQLMYCCYIENFVI